MLIVAVRFVLENERKENQMLNLKTRRRFIFGTYLVTLLQATGIPGIPHAPPLLIRVFILAE